MDNQLFNVDNIEEFKQKLKDNLSFPFFNIHESTFGYDAILISLSAEKEEDWPYGIYQNSTFMNFYLSNDGKLECFSRQYNSPKFRKCTVKNIDGVINKLSLIKKEVKK